MGVWDIIASTAPEKSCEFAQHHLDGNMGPQLQLNPCFCILAEASSAFCNSADVEMSASYMVMACVSTWLIPLQVRLSKSFLLL